MFSGKVARAFRCYFPACFLVTLFVGSTSVLLWAEIGWGEESLSFIGGLDLGSRICFAIMAGAAFVLYLFDFFNPPHLRNRYCTFNADAKFPTGSIIILGFVVLMLAACIMEADTYPWMPVLLTSFTLPALLGLVHRCSGLGHEPPDWGKSEEKGDPGGPPSVEEFREVLGLMDRLERAEEEEQAFFMAVGAALFPGAAVLLGGWICWAALGRNGVEDASSNTVRQKHIVMWVSPVITSLTIFATGILVGARVKYGELYKRTQVQGFERPREGREAEMRRARGKVNGLVPANLSAAKVSEQVNTFMIILRYVVKCFVCAVFILISGFYFMYLLATDHKNLLLMVEAFLFLWFIHATAFLYISFRPVWKEIGQWLRKQPLLTTLSKLALSDWVKALAIFCVGPLLPLLLVVSFLNQIVRRCRNLAELPVDPPPEQPGPDAASERRHLLTTRVRTFLRDAAGWDWTVLVPKVCMIGIGAVVYVLTPILLNICLSFMVSFLEPYPMAIIMVAVWFLGLVLFLLPPIPGAPVYLFSGVLVTGKANVDWGGIRGFWIGSVLSILLCWVLKLSACAMQQKGIGEMLGTKDQIRKMVGVHKPFIRAIESILRQRGMSFGKVVILCGGPDWPTSVLAGVLKLSVAQCLIGTMPIVIYIAPLSLTGSFYYKQDDGDIWQNAGALMFAITALMTIAMWVAMAWAVQQAFDRDQDRGDLTRPKPEYQELDWMDYRADKITELCKKNWSEVPICVRLAASAGCTGLVLSAQAMFWQSSAFFADFEISDDVGEFALVGAGDRSLVTIPGLIVLASAAFSCLGWLVLSIWMKRATKVDRPKAEKDVDDRRETWEEARKQEMAHPYSNPMAPCPSTIPWPSLQLPPNFEVAPASPVLMTEQLAQSFSASPVPSTDSPPSPLPSSTGATPPESPTEPLVKKTASSKRPSESPSTEPFVKKDAQFKPPSESPSTEPREKKEKSSKRKKDGASRSDDRAKPLGVQPSRLPPDGVHPLEIAFSARTHGKEHRGDDVKAEKEFAEKPSSERSRKHKTQPRDPSQKKAKSRVPVEDSDTADKGGTKNGQSDGTRLAASSSRPATTAKQRSDGQFVESKEPSKRRNRDRGGTA